MSQFEFVFSLFGLLLGLSLAEVLSGFGKAVKARRRLRIGWLTPLLGVLVMLDLTSFWTTAWAARDLLPVNYLTLMLLLAFTGLYYLVATLVFPEDVVAARISTTIIGSIGDWLSERFSSSTFLTQRSTSGQGSWSCKAGRGQPSWLRSFLSLPAF